MAAGRNMIASFILRLVDRLSPGLQRIQGMLQRTRDMAGRIGAIGAVVAGISFMAPIQSAAAFEGRLRDLAITAGQTGQAIDRAILGTRAQVNGLAREFRESSDGLLGGVEVLTARGLSPEAVNAGIRMIAEVRSASGAAENELAQLLVAFQRIANVTDEAGQRTGMAAALRAGQLGGAELRDMARYLPGVLAQMGALGTTGQRSIINASTMLQVMRDGFGTMEEAAAGAQQLIGQLMSPSTIRQAAEFGVDLRRIQQSAVRQMQRGVDIDPVEALFQGLRQALSGRPEAITELLPDQNARLAFLAWNNQVERYLSMRDELRGTTFEVVTQASRDRMQGLAAEMREFNQRIGELNDRVGMGFGNNLAGINRALEGLQNFIARIDATSPGLVENLVKLVGAGILLAGALGVLGVVAPAVAAGVALIGGPIGLAALAIAGAALLIWTHWEEIGVFFSGLWEGIKARFSSFGTWLASWVSGDGQIAWLAGAIRTAWAPLGSFFDGLLGGIARNFEALMSVIRPVLDGAQRLLGGNEGAGSDPAAQAARRAAMGNRGSAGGFYADPVLPPAQRMQGEIVVRAEPGTAAEVTRPGNRDVPLTTAPNRGPMLGLP